MLFCILVLIIVSFSLRQAHIVYTEHAAARAAIVAKHADKAMIHYANALHAWLPWLPERQRTLQEMQDQLVLLEENGESEIALKGWRRMRAGIIAVRSIWGQPDAGTLHAANHHIARLAAMADTQGLMSAKDIETESLQLLESSPRDINRFWGLMQFLLLLGWTGAVAVFLWLPQEDSRRRWLLLAAPLCFGSWLGALYLAG